MKTATDPRHRQRIKLFQKLYSSTYQPTPDSDVEHIWSKRELIDPLISQAAPEWPLDKLNPVDLAILRLAVYELTIDKQAPYKVVIDEAVEMAKEFGGEKSAPFVNGALGSLVKNIGLEEENVVK